MRPAIHKKTCPDCGSPFATDQALLQRCHPCRNDRQKIHGRVHSKVLLAVRAGKLIPQPCEACESLDVEAHHDNYDLPLEVRWFCPFHHRRLHIEQWKASVFPATAGKPLYPT